MNLNLGISITLPLTINKININDETNDKNILDDFSNFNSIQIMFSKYNLSKKEIKNIKDLIKKINYKYIFVHASYQINIGSEPLILNDNLYNPSLEIFITEIKNSIYIKASGIVVHLGKNVKNKFEPEQVFNNMVNFVIQLFNKIYKENIFSKNKHFLILFETPAGQKGDMCSDINELIEFINIFKNEYFYKNIGICIDTCHIFQAGYDLNNKNEIKKIHKIFDSVKNKIHLIHLNDSFHIVGSRLDRHAQIGKGKILVDNLIKFISPYKNLPLILETTPPFEPQIENLYS
jgi:deoxyribonuclease-4